MIKMEHWLQATMWSRLALIACSVGELETRLTSVEGHIMSSEDDEQEGNSPLESNQWERPPHDPYPAMGRELRFNQPRSRLTPAPYYMGARSAQFQQMDENPSEDHDR